MAMVPSRLLPARDLLLCAAAGAAGTFSFAPFGWWPLQFPALAILFMLVERAPGVRRAALYGWLFSSTWIGCSIWWLYVSMHRYGGLPSWMAIAAVVLLALVLGSFVAAAMAVARWLRERGVSRPMLLLAALPALWLLAEWLRGWVLTGFPWVVSGYAHTDGLLAGFAPVVGVYGLGWLAALLAACMLLRDARALVLAVLVLVAGLSLRQVEWTSGHGQPQSVRLIQGNVPQEMKFMHEQVQAALHMYRDLITEAPADLIATPETALPMLANRLPPDYLSNLQQFSNRSNSHVVIGLPVSDGRGEYANSVLGIAPQAGVGPLYRYDKHHLVPFGEFIPPGARWFVQMMNIPLGDFTPGALLQAPFAVNGQRVLPNICYEDLFGEEIAAQLAADWRVGRLPATMMLNLSNIAWFGDTIALPQHLQISRMRSLELGRPMLRATNTGVTAVIDHNGRVVAKLPPYQRATLAARVQGMQGATPYMLAGNLPLAGLAGLLLLASWVGARRRRMSGAGKTR